MNSVLNLLPASDRRNFVAKLMKLSVDATELCEFLNLFNEGERVEALNIFLDGQVEKPASAGNTTYNGTVNRYEISGGSNNRIEISYAGGGYARQSSSTSTPKQAADRSAWNVKGELVYLKDEWVSVIKSLIGDGKALNLSAVNGLKFLAAHKGEVWGSINPSNFMYVSEVVTSIDGLVCVPHTDVKYASGPACFLTMKTELFSAAKAAGLIVSGDSVASPAAPAPSAAAPATEPASDPVASVQNSQDINFSGPW